jgi:two-component system, OmpR family, response regulator
MKQRILLLEDDPNLGFVLQEHLEMNGFDVTLKTNGEEGLRATSHKRHDLCLVDVMMPKKDGFTFVREFRASGGNTPVIFLTAKSMKEDRIEGFKAGADDYVTKPFSMEELLLRIQAVLRRSTAMKSVEPAGGSYQLGKYSFDVGRHTLSLGKKVTVLTDKESQVLALLCGSKNKLVPRRDMLLQAWNDDSYFNGRSLDVYISKIRKLLASDKRLEIRNVHGKGYRLVESGE